MTSPKPKPQPPRPVRERAKIKRVVDAIMAGRPLDPSNPMDALVHVNSQPRIVSNASKKRKDEPVFETSQEALQMALNYVKLKYAPPLMNRVMGDVKRAEGPKQPGERELVSRARKRPRNPILRGLDKAAQAGMILAHFARLSPAHRAALVCATVPAMFPCECKAPCCCGFKRNVEWWDAARELCDYISEEAKLNKKKGKKGFSTHPSIRMACVEKHFNPERRIILAELADAVGVSERIVMYHRASIEEYLERTGKDGWTALDYALTHAGIVGDLQSAGN